MAEIIFQIGEALGNHLIKKPLKSNKSKYKNHIQAHHSQTAERKDKSLKGNLRGRQKKKKKKTYRETMMILMSGFSSQTAKVENSQESCWYLKQ